MDGGDIMDINWVEFATSLDKIETVYSFILLLTVLYMYGYKSTGIALSAWVIGNLMMEFVADTYMGLAKDESLLMLVRHMWYLTWIIFYVAMLRFIGDMNRIRQVKPGVSCKLIAATILLLAIAQLMRYIDRLILETDALGVLYQWIVLSLNMLPSVSISIKIISAWMNNDNTREI